MKLPFGCLFQLGPTSMEHDMQSFKEKLESVRSDFSRTGACSDIRMFSLNMKLLVEIFQTCCGNLFA